MPLYEVAFVKKPSKTEEEAGKGEELLWRSKEPIPASTTEAAIAIAGAAANDKLWEPGSTPKPKVSPNLLLVFVRPFSR